MSTGKNDRVSGSPRGSRLMAVVVVGVMLGLMGRWEKAVAAETSPSDTLQAAMEDGVTLKSQRLEPLAAVTLELPALPEKAGKERVVFFRAASITPALGGLNYNAQVQVNGVTLGRYLAGGDERLVGRLASLELKGYDAPFPVFANDRLVVVFCPDPALADKAAGDGMGGTFVLKLSDVARGVDNNTLTLTNTNTGADLVVEDFQVGWIDRDNIPLAQESLIPERGEPALVDERDGIRLGLGRGGGFTVGTPGGRTVAIETTLSMDAASESALIAGDTPSADPVKVTIEQLPGGQLRATARWPETTLVRTLRIRDGRVDCRERWLNTSDTIKGIPFRHRVFFPDREAKFYLAGSPHAIDWSLATQNPTLFLEDPADPQVGIGITAQDDWLRRLMEMRSRGGVTEIYTRMLALAPQTFIDLEYTIEPVATGGYWSFINNLRERWGINDVSEGVESPIFFGFKASKATTDLREKLRESLGRLGPATVIVDPWLVLQMDAHAIRGGAYPRLTQSDHEEVAPYADVDLDRFVAGEQREPFWDRYATVVEAIRQECPQIQILQMMHPSMEVIRDGELDQWPFAGDVLIQKNGQPFTDRGYSRSWLLGAAEHGWRVYYFAPRSGSPYLQALLDRIDKSYAVADSDGIYCDEFSFSSRRQGYSRYSYGRWDGVSADLDAQGNVVALKEDMSYVTQPAQLQIAERVMRGGKMFMCNGGSAQISTSRVPIQYFVEGGSGELWFPASHLSPVPMLLGNMGDKSSRAGLMASVRTCLENGALYSPYSGDELLLENDLNFVSKQYPMKIRRIGPGVIQGEQRLVTSVSGAYDWPGREAVARIYRYNAQGDLIESEGGDQTVGPRIDVQVPEGGLLIAELVQP